MIPVASGIWIDHFTFPFVGVHELSPWVGKPLTVLWIVAIMNMVNFLDGLDGLAAGVCSISGATFAVIALSLGKPQAAIVSAIVFGACLGFLRHNFYPARIFMGDSGAMLLGFVLATVAVEGLLKTAATVALFLPLLVLAVPILDTGLRRRPAAEVPAADHGARPRAPPLPLPARRLLPAADDGRRSGSGARRSPAPRSRRASSRFAKEASGTCGRRWPWSAIAFVALLASLTIVYLLEIVKLANPRIRRREAREREADMRKSA